MHCLIAFSVDFKRRVSWFSMTAYNFVWEKIQGGCVLVCIHKRVLELVTTVCVGGSLLFTWIYLSVRTLNIYAHTHVYFMCKKLLPLKLSIDSKSATTAAAFIYLPIYLANSCSVSFAFLVAFYDVKYAQNMLIMYIRYFYAIFFSLHCVLFDVLRNQGLSV